MTSGAIGTGLLVGPALSGILVHYGDTAPVWAATALSLISILATIVLLPPDHSASEPLYQQRVPEPTLARTILGMRYAWHLLGLLIVFFFVNSMFLSQIGLFLSARFRRASIRRPRTRLDVRLCRLHQPGRPGFSDHARQPVRIRSQHRHSGVCLHGLGFLGLAIRNGIGLLAVFLTLIIIGTMFTRSTLTAELSRSTAMNRQGMIMGLNQSLMSGANISAPLVSGALIGHQLFVIWPLAMAAIAMIGAVLARQFLAHAQPARERFEHGSIASNHRARKSPKV